MTRSETPLVPTDEPDGAASRRRLSPPRPWVVAAAAVLIAGLAAAWWMFWTVPVVTVGGFGVTVPDHEAGRPLTIGIETLCLDGPETAVVEDVTVDRGGLSVADFAVRPRPAPPALTFGAAEERLADTGFGTARSFSGQCDAGEYTEIAVELRHDAMGRARTESIDVHWRAGLRSGVLTVPVSVVLCPAGVATEVCEGDL